MVKQVIGAVLLVLICVAGYYGYKHYQEVKTQDSGDVRCTFNCDTPEQKAAFARENSGDTPDGNSEHKEHTARTDAAIAASGFPDGAGPAPGTNGATTTYPANPPTGQVMGPAPMSNSQPIAPVGPAPVATNQMGQMGTMRSNSNNMAPLGMPVSDTLTPNAPNGMAFGGKGTFQWYRQGNLTWRVDTVSGHSCIVYATMEEWQKEIVLSHGCGRNA